MKNMISNPDGGIKTGQSRVEVPVVNPNQQMLSLLNTIRKSKGLKPFKTNTKLVIAAQLHAEENALHNSLNHYSKNGDTWADRARKAGYPGADLSTIGEDIGAGQANVVVLVSDFMNSPGHRAPILDQKYTDIGLGRALSNDIYGVYWCLAFGYVKPDVVNPVPPTPTENWFITLLKNLFKKKGK